MCDAVVASDEKQCLFLCSVTVQIPCPAVLNSGFASCATPPRAQWDRPSDLHGGATVLCLSRGAGVQMRPPGIHME